MTDNARMAGYARVALERVQQQRELQKAHERGFVAGWRAAIDWLGDEVYKTGRAEAEQDAEGLIQDAYDRGLTDAGVRADELYHQAYKDGLEDASNERAA